MRKINDTELSEMLREKEVVATICDILRQFRKINNGATVHKRSNITGLPDAWQFDIRKGRYGVDPITTFGSLESRKESIIKAYTQK